MIERWRRLLGGDRDGLTRRPIAREAEACEAEQHHDPGRRLGDSIFHNAVRNTGGVRPKNPVNRKCVCHGRRRRARQEAYKSGADVGGAVLRKGDGTVMSKVKPEYRYACLSVATLDVYMLKYRRSVRRVLVARRELMLTPAATLGRVPLAVRPF